MSFVERFSLSLFLFYGTWLVADIVSMEVEKHRYKKVINLGVIKMRVVAKDSFSEIESLKELPEIKAEDTSVN